MIVSHERPDGDSVSSLLSLKALIAEISKAEIKIVSHDGVPKVFTFLHDVESVHTDFLSGDFDLIILVDCGDSRRTGFSERIFNMIDKGIKLINIDHHPKNDLHKLAILNIVDYKAASATEVIYQIISQLNIPITPNLATVLYTGLFTDTGSFQHPITTATSLNTASKLLASGAKFKELRQHLTYSKSLPMLRLWGLVLERIKINKYNFAVSIVTHQDITNIGASEEDLAGVVNLLEAISECCAAMLLVEVAPCVVRCSIRSNNSKIDVSRIANFFDGGGHPRAGGFTFYGHFEMDNGQWKVV